MVGMWCLWRRGLDCQRVSGELQWPSCLHGTDRVLGAASSKPPAPQFVAAERMGNWGKGLSLHPDWLAKWVGENRKWALQPGSIRAFSHQGAEASLVTRK